MQILCYVFRKQYAYLHPFNERTPKYTFLTNSKKHCTKKLPHYEKNNYQSVCGKYRIMYWLSHQFGVWRHINSW